MSRHKNGEAALAAASEASGVPIEQCEVYKTILGGGFGRRGAPDFIHQAVEIAKSFPGTPVKLQWTREEDQRHGFYHPTTMAKMRGSLDSQGNLTGLHIANFGSVDYRWVNAKSISRWHGFRNFPGGCKRGD